MEKETACKQGSHSNTFKQFNTEIIFLSFYSYPKFYNGIPSYIKKYYV